MRNLKPQSFSIQQDGNLVCRGTQSHVPILSARCREGSPNYMTTSKTCEEPPTMGVRLSRDDWHLGLQEGMLKVETGTSKQAKDGNQTPLHSARSLSLPALNFINSLKTIIKKAGKLYPGLSLFFLFLIFFSFPLLFSF